MKQGHITGIKEDSLSEQVSDEYRQLANSYDKRWSAYLQHTHEMARVLSPGGSLLVLDWSSDTFMFRFIEKFMRVIGKPFGKVFGRIELEKSVKSKGLNIRHSINWSWRGWSFAMIIAKKPQPKS